MAASGRALKSAGWNPLRCDGTELPPPVLLMAKLIALAFLVRHHVAYLPEPFLPFVAGLDELVPGPVFQRVVQATFLLSGFALLFNRRVRASCLVLGGTVLLCVVASRVYYANNLTCSALLLILAGLQTRDMEPVHLRWQVALVYFGAAFNKAFEPDWHSGQFFEYWATQDVHSTFYLWLSAKLPPLVLGKLMCWGSIALEFTAVVLLCLPRAARYGVVLSIGLQASFLLFAGHTFVMFFFAMQAAMFAFLRWPERPIEVIYDGDCGFCDWCREQISRVDFDRVFAWIPYQSGRGRVHGITDAAASRRLQLVTPEGRVLEGFVALRRMLLYTPAFWMAVTVLIAVARHLPLSVAPTWRRVIVAALLFFFSPLMKPLGVAVYDFVARHRHRIFPGRACKLPDVSSKG